MANTLKLRGGTTAEVAAASLAEREIMVDTTKDVIVVGPTKKEMAVGNGGTYTGNYTFSGDVTINGGVTFGTSANANNLRIQNVATPTGNSDATNKSYVDGQITNVVNTTLPGNVFSADNTITITDNNPGVGDIDLSLANNSVSTAKIQNLAVGTDQIAVNAVTGEKFANNSIVTAKIQDQAVETEKIKVSAITENRIATGAVTVTKLADGQISALKLATNSVTEDKIQDDAVTAAKIKDLTATIAELNQVDAKTLVPTSVTWSSTSDLPSAAQINSRIAATVDAVGGFVAIANEDSFPTTHPDPSSNAGTVVSIQDAGGMVINASGEGAGETTGNVAVAITGFPASMNSTTIADGMGLQVQTTSALNSYTYHKLIAKEDDILQLSSDINDFKARYRLGATDPTTNNDDGDLFYNTTGNVLKIHDGTNWSTAAAGTASDVAVTATNTLVATNVQAALTELDTDKIEASTGPLDGSAPNLNLTTDFISLHKDNGFIIVNNTANDSEGVSIAADGSVTASTITTNTTNNSINLDPAGTGSVVVKGNIDAAGDPPVAGTNTGKLVLNCEHNSHGVTLKAPIHDTFLPANGGAGSYSLTLPSVTPDVSGKALVATTAGVMSWDFAGGAKGPGNDQVFYESDQTLSDDYVITEGKNALSVSPLTIAANKTVTVPATSNWTIV